MLNSHRAINQSLIDILFLLPATTETFVPFLLLPLLLGKTFCKWLVLGRINWSVLKKHIFPKCWNWTVVTLCVNVFLRTYLHITNKCNVNRRTRCRKQKEVLWNELNWIYVTKIQFFFLLKRILFVILCMNDQLVSKI